MAYGKAHNAFWESERVERLSDRVALLALFLVTGDRRNAIGCFRLGKGAISDNPRFARRGIEGVSDALLELSDTGFIVRDDATGWTFVAKHLKHDPIKSAKVAVHALSPAERAPRNSVVYRHLIDALAPQLEAYSDTLSGEPGYPFDTQAIS